MTDLFLILLFCWMMWASSSPSDKWDSTDDRDNKVRSKMIVYTDHATGVQYLSTRWGITLTPRLDKDGKPYTGDSK